MFDGVASSPFVKSSSFTGYMGRRGKSLSASARGGTHTRNHFPACTPSQASKFGALWTRKKGGAA